MLHRSLTLICLLLFVFASGGRAAPRVATNPLAGTWKFERIDHQPIARPFYMQFHSDHTSASWPAPKDWADAKGVSRGRYAIKDDHLVIDTKSGKHDPSARFQIKGNRLTLTNDDGNQMVYRRLSQDLEPGKLENGKPAGYLQNGW